MVQGEVTYVVGGQTFRGRFEVVGHGDVRAVSLQFGNRSISANLGHDDPERLARSLLTRVAVATLGTPASGLCISETRH